MRHDLCESVSHGMVVENGRRMDSYGFNMFQAHQQRGLMSSICRYPLCSLSNSLPHDRNINMVLNRDVGGPRQKAATKASERDWDMSSSRRALCASVRRNHPSGVILQNLSRLRQETRCDRLIHQVTINCAERGLLLLRVRDEIRMTIAAYQTLYESW